MRQRITSRKKWRISLWRRFSTSISLMITLKLSFSPHQSRPNVYKHCCKNIVHHLLIIWWDCFFKMRHYGIYGHVCATLESYISWISFSWCYEKVIKKKKKQTFHHNTKWFSANFGFCNVVEIRGSKILPKTKWFSPCLRKNSLIFLFFLFSCKSFLLNHGEVAQKIGGIDLLPWNPQRWINVLVATYMQAWTVEHGCFSNYSCIAIYMGKTWAWSKTSLQIYT